MMRFFLLLLLGFPFFISAQIRLSWVAVDSNWTVLEKHHLPTSYPDTAALNQSFEKLISQLHNEGFLLASIDKTKHTDSTAMAHIFIGKNYQWLNLNTQNIPPELLKKAGYRKNKFENKPINLLTINTLQKSIISILKNTGYPFAEIKLDSITVNGNEISASLNLNKGKLIRFSSLEIGENPPISKRYLEQYLGIEDNQIYNHSKLLRIKNRIKELPFIAEKEPATIQFLFDRANISLHLKPQAASRFDFVIGILPNHSELGRLLITGNFLGEFQNQFGKGERIFAKFEQLRPQSQEIDIQVNYPYLLELPFGLDSKFALYKRDSSYLNLQFDVGAEWLLEGGDYFKAFLTKNSSQLLSIDEKTIRTTRRLPQKLDFKNTAIGIGFQHRRLDYRFNPTRGWQTEFRLTTGIKTIIPNSKILKIEDATFDFQTIYDSIQLKSIQSKINLQTAVYLPTTTNQTLKLAIQAGIHLSQSPLLKNEQFRIGGNKLLRGFDEATIFASQFSVATVEYRLLTGRNSHLFTFADFAWVADHTAKNQNDFPYGFGAGISFDTAAGIFGISYALGSQKNNPINLRSGKIHFGYLSLF